MTIHCTIMPSDKFLSFFIRVWGAGDGQHAHSVVAISVIWCKMDVFNELSFTIFASIFINDLPSSINHVFMSFRDESNDLGTVSHLYKYFVNSLNTGGPFRIVGGG